MTNQKIEITEYSKIQNNYENLYELLKDYNNSDVQPAVEAIGKLSAMFSSINLDIHKDAISIHGLSLKSLWSSKPPGIEFEFFKDNVKLYEMNSLVGGPSIVFHHYQEKNKTLILNQKVCKSQISLQTVFETKEKGSTKKNRSVRQETRSLANEATQNHTTI